MSALLLVPGLIAAVASLGLAVFMLSVGARFRTFEPRSGAGVAGASVVSILWILSSCGTFGLVSQGFSMTPAGVAATLAYVLYTVTIAGQVAALCWATVSVGRPETPA
ncbi:MAG: hypothetical protein AB8H79_25430 [Myxococcota bacterium]